MVWAGGVFEQKSFGIRASKKRKDCLHLETSRSIACFAQCSIHFGLVAKRKQSFRLLGK